MIGVFGRSAGWMPILAAGGFFFAGAVTAQAADLGGDCCADLEERIAELEATTARKGNRKVSLTISGHINEAVMYWDDGRESNAYVVTNDSGRSRFRFRGKAKINSDWSAGYRLEVGVRSARSDRVDQGGVLFNGDELVADDPGRAFDTRYAEWWIKSKTWGAVHVGWTESAAQSITETNVTQTKDIQKNADVEDWAAGFQLRTKNAQVTPAGTSSTLSAIEWRRLVNDTFIQPGEGSRANLVQYVSPKFSGFSVEASWGDDDYWDVALRHKGKHHGFKWAAGFAYAKNSDGEDPNLFACLASINGKDADCEQYGGSLSVLHEHTGLFLNFAGGWYQDNLLKQDSPFVGVGGVDDRSTFYAFQPGIEKKWHPLGKTTVFGEYFHHNGGANDRTIESGDPLCQQAFGVSAENCNIWKSEMNVYGAGVIQGIDAAAVRLYIGWRHYDADVTLRQRNGAVSDGPIATAATEDLDVVMGGALIKF